MIRYGELCDVDFINTLSKENLESSFDQESLKEYIKQRNIFHVFILEEEEKIGYLILWISDENAQVIDIVIKANKRNKGYGRKLLEYAFTFLTKNDVKCLSLEVSQFNNKAIKLYEGLGFVKERTIEKYYKDADAFVYFKYF